MTTARSREQRGQPAAAGIWSIGAGRAVAVSDAVLVALWHAPAWAQDADAVEPAVAPAPLPLAKLRAILRSAPGDVQVSARVVDLDSGALVFDANGDRAITPASVSKMLTTAAVLRLLPASHRFATEVRASPAKKGRVATLALVGGGDPSLDGVDLDRLAAAVRKAGIRQVDRLVVDTTLFDHAEPTGYSEKRTDAAYRAPIDALLVDDAALTVLIRHGARVGAPVVVELRTPSRAVDIINEARTVKGRRSDLVVFSRAGPGRRTQVVVRGRIGIGRRPVPAGRRRVFDAAAFAAGAFVASLESAGVDVSAQIVYEAAPEGLESVALHRSKDLAALVAHTNKTSNNVWAETLFKHVGARHGGAPATADKAQLGVRAALDGQGVRWDGCTLANGSGLYHANKLSAQILTDLVLAMSRDGEHGPGWKRSLSVGGVDGTLRGRFGRPEVKGRVHAKTGTLDDACALAGFAEAGDRRYAFAIIFNYAARSASPYRRVQDRFVSWLIAPEASAAHEDQAAAARRAKASRAATRKAASHKKKRKKNPRRRK